ncbi:uncharacterized protein LOC124938804 [Impatiens glandulifera]|uniref:uncharacterized protein LOC124938804 n=1 Tax=Impatiens glandulifera TaxID=253017 RepID=UPI001FB0FF64|nr:uncharacterized protein LOC124938804 [Impatiens glandulifera]XP_047335274.1 uncharacterized protein LOC124938804 [Impatiens glandulifera]XP_047335275.1 uncharacterized protein LOC124938804 [Impatiens glandulifera]XP_047335276.1 uncharacterized protein LOC124938804 [Impatiens glandulifera]
MMEHKQLNFNQPILSVRRYSSTTTPTSENTDKCKIDTSFPSLPSLPYYRSELKTGPLSNPGTVPFIWERSPGRPKDEDNPHFKNHSLAPKLPPGWTLKPQAPSKLNEDIDVTDPQLISLSEDKFEKSKDNEGKDNSDSVSNSDSNVVHDEAYLDALDTLSRTESYFLNCSMSGLDGTKEKTARAFSADPQTRDFMMGRFLPAAKAMAAEIPQSSKKQNFPRKENEVGSGYKKPPVVRPKSTNIPTTYMEEYGKEVESEDDYYDEPGNLSNKACGLLPRFCLKGSFCLLNPVPGMSMRTRVPMSPISSVRTRSSSTGLCSKSENQPTDQVSTYEQKRAGGFGGTVQHESHIKLDGSPQPSFSDSEEFHAIPGAMNNEFHDFNSGEKRLSSLQELFSDPSSNTSEGTGITNLTAEKTVYVDSVHKLAPTKSISCSSDEEILPRSLKEDDIHSLKDREENSDSNDKKSTDQRQSLLRSADTLVLSSPCSSNQRVNVDYSHCYPQRSTFSTNTKTQPAISEAKNMSRFKPGFPLPPPLPKSPSESWLCQTLSAISKSSLTWKDHIASQTALQSMESKVPSVDPKWETLVKTNKIQHQY